MSLKETYNRIAEDWHKDHGADTWSAEAMRVFAARLQSGALILDVGCGGGLKSSALIEQGFHVVGIDFSKAFIDIARREVPSGDFRVMDMRDVPTLAESFDAVFAQASLLHIPRAEAEHVLRGFAQKLKPNGLMYVAVKKLWPDQAKEAVVSESDYGYPYERFFSYFSPEEIQAYFAALDFEMIWRDISNTWIQVIGKKRI